MSPGLPPIPSIPAPGGTPAIPNIPGMPGFKLFSPTGALLMPVMKDEAKKIYQKEIDALAATKKSQVEKIPLLTDSSKEEVNAFAGCDDSGKTFVVLTEGMYQMLDLMSQCRATDETFGTNYCDEYLKELAKQQEGKAKILPLPPGSSTRPSPSIRRSSSASVSCSRRPPATSSVTSSRTTTWVTSAARAPAAPAAR